VIVQTAAELRALQLTAGAITVGFVPAWNPLKPEKVVHPAEAYLTT